MTCNMCSGRTQQVRQGHEYGEGPVRPAVASHLHFRLTFGLLGSIPVGSRPQSASVFLLTCFGDTVRMVCAAHHRGAHTSEHFEGLSLSARDYVKWTMH